MWVRVPPPAPKRQRPTGALSFLHEWTRTRGRLETCRRHVSTRGGLRRSAGRVPPPAPKKDSVPRGRCLFCMKGTRTRGRLETCRRHVSTRGGLRRSAGRVPPPAPKKDSVPRGRCIFFVLLPSDRAGHGQNGGAGGDRPKSGSCILRVDRGRNGDAACCRGKDAGCGVIAVVSGLGPRVAV